MQVLTPEQHRYISHDCPHVLQFEEQCRKRKLEEAEAISNSLFTYIHFKFRHIIEGHMTASVIILNSNFGQVCFETRSQLQKYPQ